MRRGLVGVTLAVVVGVFALDDAASAQDGGVLRPRSRSDAGVDTLPVGQGRGDPVERAVRAAVRRRVTADAGSAPAPDDAVRRTMDAGVGAPPPVVPRTVTTPPARADAAPTPPATEAPHLPPAQAIDPAPVTLDPDAGVAPPAVVAPDGGVDGDSGVPLEDGSLEALDAGEADAGSPVRPDAGAAFGDSGVPQPATPAQNGAEGNFLTALSEWLWERAEREREATRRVVAGTARDEARPREVEVSRGTDLRELLRSVLPDRRVSVVALVVLLVLSFLGLWVVDRARARLLDRGLVPRVLGAFHLALRLATVVLALVLTSRLLPSWLQPALVLAIAAGAIAVGFGAVWLLLPDVLGWLVLVTERRLRRGAWIAGEGFAGTVEQVGPRVTLLRGADGTIVSVPNRRIVRSPVRASGRPPHEIDVELRVPAPAPAETLREAIREAVLSSPYVTPAPGLIISRDPRAPDVWRLRVRLVDARFTASFEGQLLERVEEALARRRPDAR